MNFKIPYISQASTTQYTRPTIVCSLYTELLPLTGDVTVAVLEHVPRCVRIGYRDDVDTNLLQAQIQVWGLIGSDPTPSQFVNVAYIVS